MLASLFVSNPAKWSAFGRLVPDVFDSHLKLGTEPRSRLNRLLMGSAFEPRLEGMVATSDVLVTSAFFWNADVMPLCTRERIARSYSKLNECVGKSKTGGELHLYSRLLALLLRLSSLRGGDSGEIARRTHEVLDQFERNDDQQQFALSIVEKLEERSRAQPQAFDEIELTVLSEMAQNGVQTLSSVRGDGMALCEQASHISSCVSECECASDDDPSSDLHRRALSIELEGALQGSDEHRLHGKVHGACSRLHCTHPPIVLSRPRFREDLQLAKDKFAASVNNKENLRKMASSSDAITFLNDLVSQTLAAYGDVGIFDPSRLAEIDFLNHPELLVQLVKTSASR
eukprot:5891569-Prymnesium_polylepis.1